MLLSQAAASAPTPALSFAAACSPYDGPSGRLYFLDMSTETGTCDDAKSYCTARYGWGANVAKIDSDAQFSLLREFVTNLQVGSCLPGWLALEHLLQQLMPPTCTVPVCSATTAFVSTSCMHPHATRRHSCPVVGADL
jgi:hypothetical protein